MDAPVAVRLALEHNRRMRAEGADGLGVESRRRLERLRVAFEHWRTTEIARMVRAGELRYVAFSFWLWALEVRCAWAERSMRPDEFDAIWRWWKGLHPVNRLDVVRSRRHFR